MHARSGSSKWCPWYHHHHRSQSHCLSFECNLDPQCNLFPWLYSFSFITFNHHVLLGEIDGGSEQGRSSSGVDDGDCKFIRTKTKPATPNICTVYHCIERWVVAKSPVNTSSSLSRQECRSLLGKMACSFGGRTMRSKRSRGFEPWNHSNEVAFLDWDSCQSSPRY